MLSANSLCAFFTLLLPAIAWAAPYEVPMQPQPLHLLSQMNEEPKKLELPEREWAWLRQRRSLTLGVVAPFNLPFDMVYSNGDYEGISADVVAMIKQQLGLNIRVVGYANRTEAIAALRTGEIDLISRSSDYDRETPDSVLTTPTVSTHPPSTGVKTKTVRYPSISRA
jgi:two-component system sensor histidine kinase EvgS